MVRNGRLVGFDRFIMFCKGLDKCALVRRVLTNIAKNVEIRMLAAKK